MRLAVVNDTIAAGGLERRVALTPDVVARWVKRGVEVWVEAGAGDRAFFTDAAYRAAGAEVVAERDRVWREGEVILTVDAPTDQEVGWLSRGSTILGFLDPLGAPEGMAKLRDHGVTALAVELVPRSTRAQAADALSSQASLAGYKAVLLAASALPKYFPMLTTAAGTIRPAKVLIMGVGVAGLQAIATARRLGATVEAFDIRPETKEQVQSLGAKFIEIALDEATGDGTGYAKEQSAEAQRKTQELLSDRVAAADVVITTARVPGKRAPQLVSSAMVDRMKAGAIVVDLAADQGGNCAYTEAGKDVVTANGVTILGPLNLPATVAVHASEQYAKNLSSLLDLAIQDGAWNLNLADDILDGICVIHNGEVRNERVRSLIDSLLVVA